MRLFSGSDELFHLYRERLGLTLNSRLLDVGSGSGAHVIELREAGVVNAYGVDPYVPQTIESCGMPIVYRAQLSEITEKYDFITFHHSLEHMTDQKSALRDAASLLLPGGKILIRIPTVSSDAFEEYGTDWVAFDAPRHLYLHSHASIARLAQSVHLSVQDLWCDSNAMQFMASEQYRRDVPLLDPASVVNKAGRAAFSWTQRRALTARARRANARLRGDSICVILRTQ
jgi:cyclopropane fatty-acyl-phospholipid synthase-like methyltransferase